MIFELAEDIKVNLRLEPYFYGGLLIKFENGRIVHIKKDESILDPKTGELSEKRR